MASNWWHYPFVINWSNHRLGLLQSQRSDRPEFPPFFRGHSQLLWLFKRTVYTNNCPPPPPPEAAFTHSWRGISVIVFQLVSASGAGAPSHEFDLWLDPRYRDAMAEWLMYRTQGCGLHVTLRPEVRIPVLPRVICGVALSRRLSSGGWLQST